MANIEQWAIDLSWDVIARFSTTTPEGSDEALPCGFYDDFVQVACEEAKVVLIIFWILPLSKV